jgi:hypothetical protein
MLRSLNSKESFPSWVFDVIRLLQEDVTYSSDSMKIREFVLCSKSDDALNQGDTLCIIQLPVRG